MFSSVLPGDAANYTRIEIIDEQQLEIVNRYSKTNYPIAPTLFFEFHGTAAGVAEQAEMVDAIAKEHGAGAFRWASKPEERTKLWQARHDAYYAAKALRPGGKGWATDVCVPISRLAECISETKADIRSSTLVAPIVGHVGDGNFHLSVLVDTASAGEMAAAEELIANLAARAIAMDGTCTGEHGIGQGKIDYLERELGGAVAVMRAIKRAIDPAGIMNPGKIVRL